MAEIANIIQKFENLLFFFGFILLVLAIAGGISSRWFSLNLDKTWKQSFIGALALVLISCSILLYIFKGKVSLQHLNKERQVTISKVTYPILPSGAKNTSSIGFRLIVEVDGKRFSFPTSSGIATFDGKSMPFTFNIDSKEKHSFRYGIINYDASGFSAPDLGQPFQIITNKEIPSIKTYASGLTVEYKIE